MKPERVPIPDATTVIDAICHFNGNDQSQSYQVKMELIHFGFKKHESGNEQPTCT